MVLKEFVERPLIMSAVRRAAGRTSQLLSTYHLAGPSLAPVFRLAGARAGADRGNPRRCAAVMKWHRWLAGSIPG